MRQFLEKIRATQIDQHHDLCQGQKIEQELLDAKEMLRPKSNATGNDTSPTNQIDNQPNWEINKKQERSNIISSHTHIKTTLIKDGSSYPAESNNDQNTNMKRKINQHATSTSPEMGHLIKFWGGWYEKVTRGGIDRGSWQLEELRLPCWSTHVKKTRRSGVHGFLRPNSHNGRPM